MPKYKKPENKKSKDKPQVSQKPINKGKPSTKKKGYLDKSKIKKGTKRSDI